MKPFVKKIKDINLMPVKMEGAVGAHMAWLIDKNDAPVDFAMRIFKIEPNGVIPKHQHWYYHEIYCLQGRGLVKVEDQEFILEAGMVAYVPPEVPHSYKNLENEDWVFICLIPLKKE